MHNQSWETDLQKTAVHYCIYGYKFFSIKYLNAL